VPGFGRKKTSPLQDYLIRAGYVDERPPWDEDAIRAHVLHLVANHVLARLLTAAEIAQLVNNLWQAARKHERVG
jgi:hypothetical protein